MALIVDIIMEKCTYGEANRVYIRTVEFSRVLEILGLTYIFSYMHNDRILFKIFVNKICIIKCGNLGAISNGRKRVTNFIFHGVLKYHELRKYISFKSSGGTYVVAHTNHTWHDIVFTRDDYQFQK
ncbi:hypothetical protein AK88_04570 [Plasmodium fragile]|uniref:Uncharacterized protein n=1 Tax=Plasmodium fragile TaxID=5857 RepID=A0A0D9QJA8_PLAFR|nr:uncharacterized protein AK88_04570 [Plasmodium fragile]KJP85811.1 hypothetical protein AK88_04570 [Plasmodium fragile]